MASPTTRPHTCWPKPPSIAPNCDCAPRPGNSLASRDVVQQVLLLVFEFVEARLHDVTDRDHAHQLTFVHDGHVSDALGGHESHEVRDRGRPVSYTHLRAHET